MERKLKRQLQFQQIISEIGRMFIKAENVDVGLNKALEKIGTFSDASRAYIFQFEDDAMNNTYEWCKDGVEPEKENLQGLPLSMFPWWINKISDGKILNISDVSALKEEAQAEKEILEMQHIKSVLVLPLMVNHHLVGFVGFDNVESTSVWKNSDEYLLSIAAEMFSNVFQRLAHEHALEESNTSLQQALDDIKAVEMRMIHQEQMAAIGQLAAGVAHEINNPLGFVLSNQATLSRYLVRVIEILDTQKGLKLSLADQKELDYIKEDIEDLSLDTIDGLYRIKNIVKSLRDFSRIDTSQSRSRFDVKEGIENTLTLLDSKTKDLMFVDVSIDENLPEICVDAAKFNQVLLNVILNAIEAVQERDEAHGGKMWIRVTTSDEHLVLSIRDNGVGMSEETMKRAFTPFFTTKEVGKGTGLGLSIAYDVITKGHDGEIHIESESGIGTEVKIIMPIEKDIYCEQ
ncbi:MAG: GAF domain-containing protein [Clostridia bacterium]|nr:GAF domain-containing protein [Clostridia bacterium]